MTSSSASNNGRNKSSIAQYLEFQHLSKGSKIWLKTYRTEIAASSASLASTLIAYPLDSVKTRMQAYPFRSVLHCVTETYKHEGINGFIRGVSAPLVSITIVRTMSFSIYQKSKYFFDYCITAATGQSPLVHANTRGASPSLATVTCFSLAGAVSGALITFISCPFELTKLNAQIAVLLKKPRSPDTKTSIFKSPFAQATEAFRAKAGGKSAQTSNAQAGPTVKATQTKAMSEPVKITPELFKAQQVVAETANAKMVKTLGTWATVKLIYQNRGFTGLYSGLNLHMLRDTIGTAIYFGTYESCKQILANARGNSPTSPLAVVVAGGLCGITSWAIIYPIDTAKTIYQRSVLAAADNVAARVPIVIFDRAVYRGLQVSMFRSCLLNALFFSVFEATKKAINKLEIDE